MLSKEYAIFSQTRKRKAEIETLDECVPDEKVKKIVDDDPRKTYCDFLSKYNEMKDQSFEDRLVSVNSWIAYFEDEMEIRTESLKIEIDILGEKYIQNVNEVERLIKKKFKKNTNKSIKCEKLCRLINYVMCSPSKHTNRIEYVKLLLSKKLNTNYCSTNGETPFKNALDNGHVKVATLLAQYCNKTADTNFAGGETPLTLAAKKGHKKVVEFFLHNKTCVNEKNYYGSSVLMQAVRGNQLGIVRLLIENSANVNSTNRNGSSSLMVASGDENISKDIIQLLLKNNADVNAKDHNGNTSLIKAIGSGRLDIVKILLQHKADVNATNMIGETVLTKACLWDRLGILKYLIESAGVDVNFKNEAGDTTLIRVIQSGKCRRLQETVALLFKNGADVNAKNSQGKTALMIACELNSDVVYEKLKESVRLLLAANANVNMKDNKGESALDKCKNSRQNKKAIIEMLLEKDIKDVVKQKWQK